MKKVLLLVFGMLLPFFVFAGEWNFVSSAGLQLNPKNKMTPAKNDGQSDGNNYFAGITGVNIPAPYWQLAANYKIPLNFGESIIFQDANITLRGELNLTPVTYENQFIFYFWQ